ncbi:MAG: hypothetical protein PHP01_06825 [Phycisphaerae bacterium]|nr:hypothetical protein [Phycisphaerae bacterium]
MAITAPYSQYKKTNFKIGIVLLLIASVYFFYDGKYNQKFIGKHTSNGKPDSTLVFNQKAPPYLFAGAVVLAILFWKNKDKKIVADEQDIIFSCGHKIPYNTIESINKTKYESKGFFVIEYKSQDGQKKQCKISNRGYDNLDSVLELLVTKITG